MLLFRSLQRTLAELRDYQRKHEYWQSQNEKFIYNRMLLFRSLQRTLAELRDYQRKHEYWQSQNEKFIYNPDVVYLGLCSAPWRSCGITSGSTSTGSPRTRSLFITRMLLCRSLQRTLAELRDYQRKHEYWQSQNEKLYTEQASSDAKYEQRVTYEQHKERESVVNMGES